MPNKRAIVLKQAASTKAQDKKNPKEVLPGLEPGLQGSKPWVLTNYTIEPRFFKPRSRTSPVLRICSFFLSSAKLEQNTKENSHKQKDWGGVGTLSGVQRMSTPTRFELARAEPIGFQNQLLNHSDTVSPV